MLLLYRQYKAKKGSILPPAIHPRRRKEEKLFTECSQWQGVGGTNMFRGSNLVSCIIAQCNEQVFSCFNNDAINKVANRDINVGEVLIIEDPVTAKIKQSEAKNHCGNCLRWVNPVFSFYNFWLLLLFMFLFVHAYIVILSFNIENVGGRKWPAVNV